MIGQTVSHYRIIGQLGEGGMGVVYVAEDTRLGRRVALKIPSAAASADNQQHARFLREARSISSLSHPHIATVFDFGETDDGRPFIVMELVEGRHLGELLSDGALTLGRAVELIEDVAEALAEAHRRGIVHRDVKPSNVLVNERGEVKVVDFGLAKLIAPEARPAAVNVAGVPTPAEPDAETLAAIVRTHSNVMLGTPLYLSPEQVRGVPVDPRSDLFALGALLYECVAGRPAFSGQTVLEIAAQVLHVQPVPPSSFNPRVSPALDRVVLKALAKEPEARHQTAEAFVTDLRAARPTFNGDDPVRPPQRRASDAASSSTGTGTLRSGALTTLSEQLRRPRVSLGAVLLAFALALAGFWGLSRLLRAAPYQPKLEVRAFYEKGVEFLRDGAFHQASTTLARAVSIDDRFALGHARLAEALTELDYADRAKDEMLSASALSRDSDTLAPVDLLYLNAVTATVQREYPRAVEAYVEIVRRTPELAHVHVDLGRAYEKSEEIQKAIDSYREATNRNNQYATPYLRLGVLYGRKGDLPSASAAFDKAEGLYRDSGNHEGRTEVLYQRGFLFLNNNRNTDARAQLRQALALTETTGSLPQRINALSQLSAIAMRESDFEQAVKSAQEAVNLAQSNQLDNLTARSLVDLGNVYLVSARYGEAEQNFRQSLALAQRIKSPRNTARAQVNFGSLLVQQGRAGEGAIQVSQALDFYRQGNYRQEAALAQALVGRAASLRGQYDEARRIFEGLLQDATKQNNPSRQALAQQDLGVMLAAQERYPEALTFLEQRERISRAQGNQRGVAYAMPEQGHVLWRLGRDGEARSRFDQASAIASAQSGGKITEVLIDTELGRAELALAYRQFAVARSFAARALTEEEATTRRVTVKIKTAVVDCLAQAFAGTARTGLGRCEQAVRTAEESGSLGLLPGARLALARARLAAGDAAGALSAALEAQSDFGQRGQLASEHLAWLVAAHAAELSGDTARSVEYNARAADVQSRLQQLWGTDNLNSYLTRPDVQAYRTILRAK